MKYVRFLAWGCLPLLWITTALAQVVPDKGTATTVSRGPTGQITVGIAPANPSGISHNTYTDFSVSQAGVALNNRGIDASTIVNEVTSTHRSFINGAVEVLGSRAHVVVANPNGITVDGGSFLNAGGVALSGGSVRYDPSGEGRANAILPTGPGDVTVSGKGLFGSMTTLQLIAGRIRIDGPIRNTSISPNADIALVAGRSEVELDSTVSPLTTLRNWANRRDLDGDAKEILVDITPRGSLSASRISVAVNGHGAGVSYAGRGQAAIGDFTISADGKLTTKGAVIKSEKSLKITAGSIEILNDARRQSDLRSVIQGVTLLAQDGDLTLRGAVTGVARVEDDTDSKGGVTLKAKGKIDLLSENAGRLALAFSSKDDLYVEAGSLSNDAGRLLSNATTVLRIGGALKNATDLPARAVSAQTIRRRAPGLWGSLFGLKRSLSFTIVDWGSTRIPGQLGYIAGEAIDIKAGRLDNAGEIDALDGALAISAGSILNTAFYSGTLTLTKECGLTCWSQGSSQVAPVGGKINASGSADIVAANSIENGGEIVAYGNLSVSAPQVTASALISPDVANRPAGLYDAFSGSTALVSLKPVGGSFLAPAGRVTVNSSNPVLLEGGTVSGQVATDISGGSDGSQDIKGTFPGGLHAVGLLSGWFDGTDRP